MLSPSSGFSTESNGTDSQLTARAESPQQRLLERLRESNLDLSAQLRASAAQHARLVKEKDEEVSSLKDDYDQRVEELRQSQSSELKYLMALLVEQVDSIHKSHANHVRALEAEMDRLRQGGPRHRAGTDDGVDTTTFAMTETMDSPIKRAH
jgi:DNA anti-recombination protein RmuC